MNATSPATEATTLPEYPNVRLFEVNVRGGSTKSQGTVELADILRIAAGAIRAKASGCPPLTATTEEDETYAPGHQRHAQPRNRRPDPARQDFAWHRSGDRAAHSHRQLVAGQPVAHRTGDGDPVRRRPSIDPRGPAAPRTARHHRDPPRQRRRPHRGILGTATLWRDDDNAPAGPARHY